MRLDPGKKPRRHRHAEWRECLDAAFALADADGDEEHAGALTRFKKAIAAYGGVPMSVIEADCSEGGRER